MKRLIVLGSTGSIGQNTLKVAGAMSRRFQVVGLSCSRNIRLLSRQIKLFRVRQVAVKSPEAAKRLRRIAGLGRLKIYSGPEASAELVRFARADQVVTSIVGGEGLMPIVEAVRRGMRVAIANKEPLVMAGELITRLAKKCHAQILPIDSEHSAIFQCLNGTQANEIRRLLLTGSGGPFLRTSRNDLARVSPRQAVRHPKWRMGKKISVDSATLMNKGLEIIEAQWLFGVGNQQIDVVIHPEAVVHSMVEFVDGSILAQMGITDMRLPIQYALTYPERLPSKLPSLDIVKMNQFHFEKPDQKRFPCLGFARDAAKMGKTMPTVLNAANEVAVEAFLNGKIQFFGIAKTIERVMKRHRAVPQRNLNQILSVDRWAREEAMRFVS
jgi:1-deoxy-D-xylulose-5-phosphate reductoisomerase